MPKRGKKYSKALNGVPSRETPLENPTVALELVKSKAYARFDESVEIAVRLGVDPRHADQVVRGTVVLPHGTGKKVRVLVFAQGEKVKEAEEAGADFIGLEHVAKVKEGWTDFDVAVATPDVMGQVGQLGRILGPRGLMPSPKAGTVTFDVAKAVSEIKAGKIEFRVDKNGIVHAPFGKTSFSADQLAENLRAVADAVIKAKPAVAKGTYLKKATISSTMGPGIRLDTSELQSAVG